MTHKHDTSDCGGERTEYVELVTVEEHVQLIDRHVRHAWRTLFGYVVLFVFILLVALSELQDAKQIRLLSETKSAAILELQEKVCELQKRTVPLDRTAEVHQLQDKVRLFEIVIHDLRTMLICFDTRQDNFDNALDYFRERQAADYINVAINIGRLLDADLVTQQRICDLDHRIDVITAFTKRIRPCSIFSLQKKRCRSVR